MGRGSTYQSGAHWTKVKFKGKTVRSALKIQSQNQWEVNYGTDFLVWSWKTGAASDTHSQLSLSAVRSWPGALPGPWPSPVGHEHPHRTPETDKVTRWLQQMRQTARPLCNLAWTQTVSARFQSQHATTLFLAKVSDGSFLSMSLSALPGSSFPFQRAYYDTQL